MGKSVINQLCDIFEEYNKTLKENNTMDFSDLIINLRNILLVPEILEMVQKRFKYFIVDEYQFSLFRFIFSILLSYTYCISKYLAFNFGIILISLIFLSFKIVGILILILLCSLANKYE